MFKMLGDLGKTFSRYGAHSKTAIKVILFKSSNTFTSY